MSKEILADQNDAFRQGDDSIPGEVVLSLGVASQYSNAEVQEITQKVRDFDDFDVMFDPFGEHNFGAIDYQEKTLHWKIDYSDQEGQVSEDPANLTKTVRILTIRLDSED